MAFKNVKSYYVGKEYIGLVLFYWIWDQLIQINLKMIF